MSFPHTQPSFPSGTKCFVADQSVGDFCFFDCLLPLLRFSPSHFRSSPFHAQMLDAYEAHHDRVGTCSPNLDAKLLQLFVDLARAGVEAGIPSNAISRWLTGEMRFLREMLRWKTLGRDSKDSEWIISIQSLLEQHFQKSNGERQSSSPSANEPTHHVKKKESLFKPEKKIELDGKIDAADEFDDEFDDLFTENLNSDSTVPKLNAKKDFVNTTILPSSLETRPTRSPLSEINFLLSHLSLLKSPGNSSSSSSTAISPLFSSSSTAISFSSTSKACSPSFLHRSRHLVGDAGKDKVFHLSDFVRDVGNRLNDEFQGDDADIDEVAVGGFKELSKLRPPEDSDLRSDVSLVSDQIIIALLSPFTDAHSIPTLDDLALHLDKLTERVKIHSEMGVGGVDRNRVVRGIVMKITGLDVNPSSSNILHLRALLFSGNLTSGHKHLGFKSNASNTKQQLLRPTQDSLRDLFESDAKVWLRTTISAFRASGVRLVIAKGIVDSDLKTSLDEIGIAIVENIETDDLKMLVRDCGFRPIVYPTEEQIKAAGVVEVVAEKVESSRDTVPLYWLRPSKPSLSPHYTAILHAPGSAWSALKADRLRHLLRRWEFFGAEGRLVGVQSLLHSWMTLRLSGDPDRVIANDSSQNYTKDLSEIARTVLNRLFGDGMMRSFINCSVLEKFLSMTLSAVDSFLCSAPNFADDEML